MKVLVIEDEKTVAESIRAILESKGFEVETVYDGEAGTEYAELGIYDLLILDVMMTKLNGFQVARQVRALDQTDSKELEALYLLDDATSALDEKTERKILETLRERIRRDNGAAVIVSDSDNVKAMADRILSIGGNAS